MLITNEMIISSFISKVVSNVTDLSVKKMKDALSPKKTSEQNIETRIYQVTVKTLNKFASEPYDEQDVVYNAAENILRAFKTQPGNINAIKDGLKLVEPQLTDSRYIDFLEKLVEEIRLDTHLHNEIKLGLLLEILKLLNDTYTMNKTIYDRIIKALEDNKKQSEEEKQLLYFKIETILKKYPNPNRVKEYSEKWKQNVFLNNFNPRDEDAKKNIKLCDIYKKENLPSYKWCKNTKISYDLEQCLSEYVASFTGKKMLLILGHPGIGKSTLITWLLNNYKEKESNFLVYRFAPDLKYINWQKMQIFDEVLTELSLEYEMLEGKVLILDGFDEISTDNNREDILNKFYENMAEINLLNNFSLIITCRQNYIYNLHILRCEYITLQEWNEKQITNFCKSYEIASNNEISQNMINKILINKKTLGIPLILYMVLALGINIEENHGMMDIYDKIFSLEKGSIYDRCIKDSSREVRNSSYEREHKIISETKIKNQIHQISQQIAFKMFEKKSEEASITKEEFEEILNSVMTDTSEINENVKRNFLIGNYLKQYCPGFENNEIYFVHRSIYEYFVVINFWESLSKSTSKEMAAGKFAELLKDALLSEQILDYIKYKFDKMNQGKYNLANMTKEIFQKMLQSGMTYYIGKPLLNVMDREINIFSNMLKIVHLWNNLLGSIDQSIISYLIYNRRSSLMLKGIVLEKKFEEKFDLSRIYLEKANLEQACLSEITLSEANLQDAHLQGAHLEGTHLEDANLKSAHLEGAHLKDAYFTGSNLELANLQNAHLEGAHLENANLKSAHLEGAYLESAHLENANLKSAHLEGAHLEGAYLENANLKSAHLKGAHLEGAYFTGTNLELANLQGAHLQGTHLGDINLYGADLSEANLKEVHLCRASLVNAELKKADLSGAIIQDTNFSGAILVEADFSNALLDTVNLSGAVTEGTNFSGAAQKNTRIHTNGWRKL